jgi:hypothetical protein
MTCIRLDSNTIVCVNPGGRLKLGNRYVWLDFHPYCGPNFSWDRNGSKPYDPVDENDPIWPLFEVWHQKYKAKKARAAIAKATGDNK